MLRVRSGLRTQKIDAGKAAAYRKSDVDEKRKPDAQAKLDGCGEQPSDCDRARCGAHLRAPVCRSYLFVICKQRGRLGPLPPRGA